MSAVRVRAMTGEDVSRVVEIHLAAFPGFFLSFLGPRFLNLFYREAVALGEIAFVAHGADAGMVGFVMGSAHPGGFYRRLLARRALSFGVAALPALMRRPGSALRIARALTKPASAERPVGTATLMSIAVDPRTQKTGAGKTLVAAFLKEAAARGARQVDLTTDKFNNDATNRFYSGLGFSLARDFATPEGRVMNEYRIGVTP